MSCLLRVLFLNFTLADDANVQNETIDYRSTSQSDYAKHQVPFPVHAKRKLSEKLVLGEDSPTYNSTSSAAYKGVQLTTSQHHDVPDDVNQLIDHVVLGSPRVNDMLSINQRDYIKHNLPK